MKRIISLCGRGLRYVRQYGPVLLYYKIKERRERNQAEAGYEAWLKERLEEEKATVKEAEELSKKAPLSVCWCQPMRHRPFFCVR